MRRVVLTSSLSCLVLLISLFAVNGPSASAARPTARYIVTLQAAKAADPAMAARSDLAEVGSPGAVQVFEHALRGYVADLDESQARSLRGRPGVASVERDGIVTLSTTQPDATWGLDRIDQRNRPGQRHLQLQRPPARGSWRTSSTPGIRATHQDFAGRVVARDQHGRRHAEHPGLQRPRHARGRHRRRHHLRRGQGREPGGRAGVRVREQRRRPRRSSPVSTGPPATTSPVSPRWPT